jgi:2-octaprenyl-6-methoxyphenol hydroxylase
MFNTEVDILIIGGGLVGLSLAKGLEDRGISYLLVDKPIPASSHKMLRALALSKTSIAILKHLNVWSKVEKQVSTIHHIHVSCEGALGMMELEDKQHDFLGKVIDLSMLHQALKKVLHKIEQVQEGQFEGYDVDTKTVTVMIEGNSYSLRPKIVIAADGAESGVRKACRMPIENYAEQVGMLAQITLKNPHEGHAFERFTQAGPLALLPWKTHDMAMVWGLPLKEAEFWKNQSKSDIQAMLKLQFSGRIGDIQAIKGVGFYPLKQMFMPRQSFKNILFLGNAAHTLHPVAGQGFNLSLRDVACLLDTMEQFGIGQDMFPVYAAMRYKDQRLTQWITYFLAQDFQKIPRWAKGLGLGVMNQQTMFKEMLGRYAQGLGYKLPNWVYDEMGDLDE